MAEEEVFRVRIEVDTSGATHEIDNVRESATEANQSLELLKKAFEGLKEAISLPIEQFKILSEVVVDLIDEYDKTFTSTQRVAASLVKYGEAAGEVSEHLKEMTIELSENSRFLADQIRNGEAAALSANLQGEALDRTLKIAVNVARFYDVDYVTAVNRVVRAVETGTLIIGRNTIELSLAQDAAQRTANSLTNLEDTFTNLAVGGADPIISIQKAIVELKSALGEILSDSPKINGFFEDFKDAIDTLTKSLRDNADEFVDLFGTVFIASFEIAKSFAKAFFEVVQHGLNGILETLAYLKTSSIGSALGFDQESGAAANEFIAARERAARLKREIEQGHPDTIPEVPVAQYTSEQIEILKRTLAGANDELAAAREKLLGLGDAASSVDKIEVVFTDVKEAGERFFDILDKIGRKSVDTSELTANAFAGIQGSSLGLYPQPGRSVIADLAKDHEAAAEATRHHAAEVQQLTPKLHQLYDELIKTADPQALLRSRENDIQDLQQNLEQKGTRGGRRYGQEPFTPEQLQNAYDQATVSILKNATDVASGWTVALAQTRLAAENNAKAIGDVYNVVTASIADALTQLEQRNGTSWREISKAAITEIQKIINQLLVLKAIGGLSTYFSGLFSSTNNFDAGQQIAPGGYSGGFGAGDYVSGGGFEGHASGGSVLGGKTILVGENGPELFTPQTGGTITPNRGISGSPRISIINVTDPDEIAQYLASGAGDQHIINAINRNRQSLAFTGT